MQIAQIAFIPVHLIAYTTLVAFDSASQINLLFVFITRTLIVYCTQYVRYIQLEQT